jgi:hypothetical protein
METYTHEVLRPFNAGGARDLKQGDRVDASSWPNTRQLVNCRYLAPIIRRDPEPTTEVIKPKGNKA